MANTKKPDDSLYANLDMLAKAIPLSYVVLVAFSTIGNFFYFRVFGVPVFSYLSLQDLIVLSFSDLIGLIYLVIVVYVTSYFFQVIIRSITLIGLSIANLFRKKKKQQPLSTELGNLKLTHNGFILALIWVTLYLISVNPFGSLVFWFMTAINLLLLILLNSYVKVLKPIFQLTIFLFLCFQVQAIHKTAKAQKILDNGSGQMVRFNKDDELFKSDMNKVVVGKTKDHLFILDRIDSMVRVINISNIQEMQFGLPNN